jgi:hypothetical protein
MAAGLTAAELNPLARVAVPPAAVADRVGTEVGAPLPCAAWNLRTVAAMDSCPNDWGGVGGMIGGQLKRIWEGFGGQLPAPTTARRSVAGGGARCLLACGRRGCARCLRARGRRGGTRWENAGRVGEGGGARERSAREKKARAGRREKAAARASEERTAGGQATAWEAMGGQQIRRTLPGSSQW